MGMLLTEEAMFGGLSAGVVMVIYIVLIFGFVYFARIDVVGYSFAELSLEY